MLASSFSQQGENPPKIEISNRKLDKFKEPISILILNVKLFMEGLRRRNTMKGR